MVATRPVTVAGWEDSCSRRLDELLQAHRLYAMDHVPEEYVTRARQRFEDRQRGLVAAVRAESAHDRARMSA